MLCLLTLESFLSRNKTSAPWEKLHPVEIIREQRKTHSPCKRNITRFHSK